MFFHKAVKLLANGHSWEKKMKLIFLNKENKPKAG
jgi:hypothetical protein